ncbi:MAG: hypothetical protein IJB83_01850 [Bacilli bacterium]|nr:hypothetical protein [Bacilli bacterium]
MDLDIDVESFFSINLLINACISEVKSFANSFCSLNLSDLSNVSINKDEINKAVQDLETLASKMDRTTELFCLIDESNATLFSTMKVPYVPVFGEESFDFKDLIVAKPDWYSQSEWSQLIIDTAMKMFETQNGEFRYISPTTAREDFGTDEDNPRVLAYNGEKYNGYYHIDCNAFVSIVLNQALGIGSKKANSEDDFKFVAPGDRDWYPLKDDVKQIATGLTLDEALELAQPGDILGSVGDGDTHVQIYVGDGVVIDNGNAVPNAPISLRTKDGHPQTGKKIRHQNGVYTILRVDESYI